MLELFNSIELSQTQKDLISALMIAHMNATFSNKNLSKDVFLASLQGSSNALQAVCAGLLSTGSTHAPVIHARDVLFNFEKSDEQVNNDISHMVRIGLRVPGFGNSFFKDNIDPAFQPIYDFLSDTIEGKRIDFVNNIINKGLFPNAACLTAAVASYCNLPRLMELWLFIAPRTASWLYLLK